MHKPVNKVSQCSRKQHAYGQHAREEIPVFRYFYNNKDRGSYEKYRNHAEKDLFVLQQTESRALIFKVMQFKYIPDQYERRISFKFYAVPLNWSKI